jgi:hypothetical protein
MASIVIPNLYGVAAVKFTDIFARLKNICHIPVGRTMDAAGNQYWHFHWKLHRDGGQPAYLSANGKHREFYKYGNLHREDGPAKELADGGYEYFLNGLRHRDGGLPAVVHANGDKMWYENDKLHRNDGPAVEKADGFEWWQGGEKWLQGSTVTPQIQEEKKAAALEKVVEQATVTDEKVQVLAPIKFKKPGSTPTP